jgi:hypothetical protein
MQWRMNRDLRQELYLSLLLLGADPILLGALETWREGADEQDVLADVRNWNEAKRLEMKEWLATMSGAELEQARSRIHQYENARSALKQAA